jgi:hypothetical protein
MPPQYVPILVNEGLRVLSLLQSVHPKVIGIG